ncbi:hypothetical protein [Croceicoccus esteveae]|uniref:hypothetical protein n=1 Tax=Croceicoccus esteveae TaxID=3075597 RepID=UPI003D775096
MHLSERQASDCKQADPLLDAVSDGSTFLADKACDSDAIRAQITAQGGFANTPPNVIAEKMCLQCLPLPLTQPDRTLLWKTQTHQRLGHALRQAR